MIPLGGPVHQVGGSSASGRGPVHQVCNHDARRVSSCLISIHRPLLSVCISYPIFVMFTVLIAVAFSD